MGHTVEIRAQMINVYFVMITDLLVFHDEVLQWPRQNPYTVEIIAIFRGVWSDQKPFGSRPMHLLSIASQIWIRCID